LNNQEFICSLVQGAQRRFLSAARLLEIKNQHINQVDDLLIKNPVPLWPFVPALRILETRYFNEVFSPQLSLLEPNLPEDQMWSQFFHWKLLPHLLREDYVVRSVLRLSGALPCSSLNDVAHSLATYFSEITLPSRPPLWAPEDQAEHGAS
jgi:hypothetical protein